MSRHIYHNVSLILIFPMALKKVKGTLERVLDKNMQDLVRGIRNHKECEVCANLSTGSHPLYLDLDLV